MTYTDKVAEHDAKLAPILLREANEESLTADESDILALEYLLCAASFLRFLGYCKLEEPSVPGDPYSGGVVPFTLWPHLLEMAGVLLTERLIIILKSRQIGASWLMAAYDLWWAKFHQSSNVFLYSKGEEEAWEKLDKCRRVEKHLPFFLRHTIKPDSNSIMKFVENGSVIRAFPATADAGIGWTASILDMDELEKHPYANQNYSNAKPTIDAGGQYIGVFTVDKLKPVTLAKTLFTQAWYTPEDSAFKALFFDYTVRPGRDEEWYERKKRETPPEDLDGLSPELYMEQNYPRSAEEALEPTQTMAAFDLNALKGMLENVKSPVKITESELDLSIVNIYEDFHIGNYYIGATDTSHGVGQDYSTTGIMNVKTGAMVADIMRNDIPPEELALHSFKLLERFHFPKWYIEANEWGGVTISKAKALQYRNLGYQDEKRTKVGFLTESHKTKEGLKGTRIDLFGQLIPAINNYQIIIYNIDGLRQFFDVIRNAAKEGRIEAKQGRHDDYPIVVGICWLKKDEVVTGPAGQVVETLDFGRRTMREPGVFHLPNGRDLSTLTFR